MLKEVWEKYLFINPMYISLSFWNGIQSFNLFLFISIFYSAQTILSGKCSKKKKKNPMTLVHENKPMDASWAQLLSANAINGKV